MNTTVKKQKLIDILTRNRDNHRTLFEEALEGYKRRTIEELNKHVERLHNGDPIKVFISMAPPTDHTNDYNRAIRMLELNEKAEVELDEMEAATYIMDDWGWKPNFVQEYTASTGKTI